MTIGERVYPPKKRTIPSNPASSSCRMLPLEPSWPWGAATIKTRRIQQLSSGRIQQPPSKTSRRVQQPPSKNIEAHPAALVGEYNLLERIGDQFSRQGHQNSWLFLCSVPNVIGI